MRLLLNYFEYFDHLLTRADAHIVGILRVLLADADFVRVYCQTLRKALFVSSLHNSYSFKSYSWGHAVRLGVFHFVFVNQTGELCCSMARSCTPSMT